MPLQSVCCQNCPLGLCMPHCRPHCGATRRTSSITCAEYPVHKRSDGRGIFTFVRTAATTATGTDSVRSIFLPPEIPGNRASAYGAICSAVGRVHGVTLNWENTVQQKCLSLNHPRIPRCSHRGSTSKLYIVCT